MKSLPKILMIAAAISMLFMFLFPIWRITLQAPQYPDGITMYIWINQITGDTEYTLQNINILNHYVGMKYIEPDSIPELTYFPYIIAGMAFLALVIAFIRNRYLPLAWLGVIIILGILGIYDFYLWEYDYGHNLDPTAPIKVPGQAYQPPVFGSKMLLNFKADSYPYIGSLFLVISMVLAFLAYWFGGRKKNTRQEKPQKTTQPSAASTLLLVSLFAASLSACSIVPSPIVYGEEGCDFCRMTIVDERYGSEIVTDKGKVYKFDAIECMIHFLESESFKGEKAELLLTTDFTQPGKLIDARISIFLRSENLPSPMGMFLNAFEHPETAKAHQEKHSGQLYDWQGLSSEFSRLANNHQ